MSNLQPSSNTPILRSLPSIPHLNWVPNEDCMGPMRSLGNGEMTHRDCKAHWQRLPVIISFPSVSTKPVINKSHIYCKIKDDWFSFSQLTLDWQKRSNKTVAKWCQWWEPSCIHGEWVYHSNFQTFFSPFCVSYLFLKWYGMIYIQCTPT